MLRHQAWIYNIAVRMVFQPQDAEEVTQDVLFKVYRKVATFRGDAALSSWIYRITFNAAMSRLRTARYQRALDEKRKIVVGVNDFIDAEEHPLEILYIDESVEEQQKKALAGLRRTRDGKAVTSALASLKQACADGKNVMPSLIEAVKTYATVGEISFKGGRVEQDNFNAYDCDVDISDDSPVVTCRYGPAMGKQPTPPVTPEQFDDACRQDGVARRVRHGRQQVRSRVGDVGREPPGRNARARRASQHRATPQRSPHRTQRAVPAA